MSLKNRDIIIKRVENAFAEGEATGDFSFYEELKQKY
jgi:hypothetical protein